MKSDRPRELVRCDNCGRIVPPTYFKTDLPDGPIKVCGTSCGDEIAKTLKIAERWQEVER